MVDSDSFFQFIVVPDDRPGLPPVDEEISGLKDFSSLGIPADLHINRGSGLLLGQDPCHNVCHSIDSFDAIVLSPSAGQNAFFPTPDSSPSYTNLFLPALSPDSSPSSVASTPWLRTPQTDPSLANVANSTPVDALWDIAGTEESCATIHFLDQSGNNLEDIPSHVQDVMPEDIACTPQITPGASPLPPVDIATPPTPLSNTPIFAVSPPPGASTFPSAEAVSLEQAHHASLSFSPHISQSLFGFSQSALPTCTLSPLSPLSAVSLFSQSPSTSPYTSPFINCFPLSSVPSPVPSSINDETVGVTDSITPALTSVKRVQRDEDTLDDEAPPWKMSRRSKTKNVDDEEWIPGSERVKRPRTAVPIQNLPQDESPECTTSQALDGHSDATPTTCEICGQGFTRASDYVRHIQNSASHPETRKVWPCPYCDGALGRKDALKRHIKTIHPGKATLILESISGSQFHEIQEPTMQLTGQRKLPSKKRPRKDTRKYR